jgi:hypothetical protein
LWLPSRIFEKKIDLCKNYAEIRAFDGIPLIGTVNSKNLENI